MMPSRYTPDSAERSSSWSANRPAALGLVLCALFALGIMLWLAVLLGLGPVGLRQSVANDPDSAASPEESDYYADTGSDSDGSGADGSGADGGEAVESSSDENHVIVRVLGPGDDEPLIPLATALAGTGDASSDPLAQTAESPSDSTGPGDDEPLGPGEDEPLGPGEDEPLGPGEDEPLAPRCGESSEGQLELRLLTSHAQRATVLVTSGSSYVASRPLHSEGAFSERRDEASGLFELPISLDLEWLASVLDRDDLRSPSGGLLDLTLTLHSYPEGKILGSQRWEGHVLGRPWIEFLPGLPSVEAGSSVGIETTVVQTGSSDDPAQESNRSAQVQAILFPPVHDSYFLLVGGHDRESILRSPDDPDALSGVSVLSGGALNSDERVAIVRYLDSPYQTLDAVRYVVLWTFNDVEGWCHSPVYPVP